MSIQNEKLINSHNGNGNPGEVPNNNVKMTDNLKRYSCVIFDLDGTLVDSFQAYKDAIGAVLSSFPEKKEFPENPNALVNSPSSVHIEKLFGKIVGKENQDAAMEIFVDKYNEVCFKKTSLITGVKDLLTYLKDEGKSLNVATNKPGPISRDILKHLGIDKFFDCIYGTGDGMASKPSPQMLDKIIEEKGYNKSDVIFVGDSPNDIITAKNAGVPVISIASGNHTREELRSYNPNFLCSGLSDANYITDVRLEVVNKKNKVLGKSDKISCINQKAEDNNINKPKTWRDFLNEGKGDKEVADLSYTAYLLSKDTPKNSIYRKLAFESDIKKRCDSPEKYINNTIEEAKKSNKTEHFKKIASL
jgi:phosphoglycolate phosphatase